MKKGAEEYLGGTRGAHQAGTPHGGAASLGWRHALVWATPGPPLTLSPATFFSLPSKLQFIAQNRVLAVLLSRVSSSSLLKITFLLCLLSIFSISLLSVSLLLKFGALVLWYVTPPLVQVDLCLVDYILSILLL